jgi:uncharacterized surface anchored protein
MRSARLVMIVVIAMFVVAVPTAMAQSPLGDQYTAPLSSGDSQGAGAAGSGAAPNGAAPVEVRQLTNSQADSLPFTGGQISLIALIGLGLLAAGTVGIASTRRRASTTAS